MSLISVSVGANGLPYQQVMKFLLDIHQKMFLENSLIVYYTHLVPRPLNVGSSDRKIPPFKILFKMFFILIEIPIEGD